MPQPTHSVLRLDAFLAKAGLGSRKDVKRLLRSNEITIDGERARSGKALVRPDAEVRIAGQVVELPPEIRHLVLHKPPGYACSRDPRESPLIFDLLPEAWEPVGLQPVGRLDRETSGLLVLTSDGQLIHQLTHPRHGITKRYRVVYRGELPSDAVARCAAGLKLPDDPKPTKAADLALEGPGAATLVLHEGRYHQVRRMFAVLGAEVIELHRDRVGSLDLPPDLPEGQCRPLSEKELLALSTPAPLDG